MKLTMSFNLPEEREEYNQHKHGPEYHSAILEFLQEFCRSKLKYQSQEYSEEYLKAVREAREFLQSSLESENVLGDF